MLKLKDSSVLVEGLKPELYYALGVADQAYADEGIDCIVTAALDGQHNPNSLHSTGYAVDLRNTNLNSQQHDHVLIKLTRLERLGFDVIDEKPGATGATTNRHFHLEFSPKSGESFWHTSQ